VDESVQDQIIEATLDLDALEDISSYMQLLSTGKSSPQ
jgi:hypothetical protein